MSEKPMNIAFVCDWLTGMRGGEKCLRAMCELYPEADIFTLVHYPENFHGEFDGHAIHTSFIQKLPGNDRTFRRFLPLFPRAIESFDFQGYDLVVSFSHCVAKGVKVPDETIHICYCHTPMRYAWQMRNDYLSPMRPLKKKVISLLLDRLKAWDQATADRVDDFIANSGNVQQRIQQAYGRNSTVIYPPLDIDRFAISSQHDDYYLILSAMVPYKRIDLAISAFNQNGRLLKVAGVGPEYAFLRSLAKSNIEFIPDPDDQTVEQLYAGCKALVFPGQEDFGIVTLEAQACGKPVIAYGRGGALETVIDIHTDPACATGILFDAQTVSSLEKAIAAFETRQAEIPPENCRHNAERFGACRYKTHMAEYIETRCSAAADSGQQADERIRKST